MRVSEAGSRPCVTRASTMPSLTSVPITWPATQTTAVRQLPSTRLATPTVFIGTLAMMLSVNSASANLTNTAITVASYYFGNYHPSDPRNVKMKGQGWSEWELIKAAKPRRSEEHTSELQ